MTMRKLTPVDVRIKIDGAKFEAFAAEFRENVQVCGVEIAKALRLFAGGVTGQFELRGRGQWRPVPRKSKGYRRHVRRLKSKGPKT